MGFAHNISLVIKGHTLSERCLIVLSNPILATLTIFINDLSTRQDNKTTQDLSYQIKECLVHRLFYPEFT